MSHRIVIGGGGGSPLVAQESTVTGELTWTPSHALTPAQERRRIERANVALEKLKADLTAPVAGEE